MNTFFDCCVTCKKTFTNEQEFFAHKMEHEKTKNASSGKPIDEVEAKIKAEAANVPGVSVSDESKDLHSKEAKEISSMRKKLIHAGIEAQTMKPEEVKARYEAEKEKGTVK